MEPDPEIYGYRTFYKGEYGYAGKEYAAKFPHHLTKEALELFMGRPKGSTNRKTGEAPVKAKGNSELFEALTFVGIANTDRGNVSSKFCKFDDGFVLMTDGVISAGYPVEEEFELAPNFEFLKKALKQCGKSFSITELQTNRWAVKGQNIRVMVPCIEFNDYPDVKSDPMIAVVDDRLKHGFVCVGSVADENEDIAYKASVLLEANTVTATNGKVLMQYWHGINLPPELVVPKIFVKAVVAANKPLVGFGWDYDNENKAARSITFYFEGGAWIKTLLYTDKYPNVAPIIDIQSNAVPVMPTLFEAIAKTDEFSENGLIYLHEGKAQTDLSEEVGAQFEIAGFNAPTRRVNAEQCKIIAPFVTHIDFNSYSDRTCFFGDNMRGILVGVVTSDQV